ncbi:MAG: ATP-dependent DNA ligase [Gemmatimonadales bacterium]|nr:MAG: ATP-dependent DNA ligase [Gemmatimonadales bacterium]
MKRFVRLFVELDRTTRTTEKVAALERYFAAVPPADAAWATSVLMGRRVKRAAGTGQLREWVAEASGTPLWLVEESYDAVGDLAETLALLLPPPGPDAPPPPPLHRVMEDWILPLPELDDEATREVVETAWRHLDETERLVFHKLLTGGFRVGVGKKLVTRALAAHAGMDPAVLAHRLTGPWSPDPDTFRTLVDPDADLPDAGRPYPFLLAHPLQLDPLEPEGARELGPVSDWIVEWKWDGIRAQLIRRDEEVLLWSRGEEVVTPAFPEIEEAARLLPPGTVLDGELLAVGDDRPLPFAELQRRLGRKRVGPKILRDVPVKLLAWDLLEDGGRDARALPQAERRGALEALFRNLPERGIPLALSREVDAPDWEALARLREGARDRGVEGFMLKRRDAPYGAGRERGTWWKWKVDPLTLDAVLMYAQRGHGRRASLYTDYTFGVWDGDDLVPVGKAYSGLTDKEIRETDRWIRRHIVEKFGPVRSVEPGLVFELAFDSIRRSSRHRSGVALRFPRMARRRPDKAPAEADTLARVRALLPPAEGHGPAGPGDG